MSYKWHPAPPVSTWRIRITVIRVVSTICVADHEKIAQGLGCVRATYVVIGDPSSS